MQFGKNSSLPFESEAAGNAEGTVFTQRKLKREKITFEKPAVVCTSGRGFGGWNFEVRYRELCVTFGSRKEWREISKYSHGEKPCR